MKQKSEHFGSQSTSFIESVILYGVLYLECLLSEYI